MVAILPNHLSKSLSYPSLLLIVQLTLPFHVSFVGLLGTSYTQGSTKTLTLCMSMKTKHNII